MRTKLLETLAKELVGYKHTYSEQVKYFGLDPLTDDELEELRKTVTDCEQCGLWVERPEVCHVDGEEVCEECADRMEE